MKLSRALSDLVKYTKSVAMQDLETQGTQGTYHTFRNAPVVVATKYLI